MNRIALPMEDSAHLVVAETNADDFRRMGGEPVGRPVRKAVAERQGIGRDGLPHGGEEFRGRSSGTPRGLDGSQSVDPGLAVQAAKAIDREDGTTQPFGDRGDGIAGVGHEDNETVAVNVGRFGRESKAIESIDLRVGELDTSSHDNLPAMTLPKE
jgi:hypothetical protein